MTPQEEQLLSALIDRLNQTPLQEKDPDAEALLKQRLAGNPDAVYMLSQTVLVQNIALDQAKAQVSQLQEQLQQLQQQRPQPAHTTSFLGRLLGERDDQPAPPRQASAPAYQQVPPQYAQPAPTYPQYGQPQYPPAQFVPVGGQPSFLRGAMQTAAGVAAGALAFEGVESLLHGVVGGFGPGYGTGGLGGERPVEVINNYYDEPGRGAGHENHMVEQAGMHSGDAYDPRNNDPSDNLRGFDDRHAAAANDQDLSPADDISTFADQASFDDQNIDDPSGFDDSGGLDDGGGFDGGDSSGF